MKALLIAALMFVSAPAFAGKMKEIYIMTTDSILENFGFDDSQVQIDDYKFVTVEGEDLAVQTTVRVYYTRAVYTCVTTFKKTEHFYDVKNLRCK
ncbi:hypothetical protein [Bdellovibrio bacteriovorus]|uniref:Uncharacterized protein n=3 Tax=Bdellovibrio bacteriovorus TaxID=959 RepID=Q6MPX8_BDEBA|nr:hypothetical protein [Bdellovibrio bacteriovorus]AFY00384.1 hypothetical protein Bdt_0677 [Bdellovibrio bacteriovorus str. Tiberius]AHZ86778.1 hypothetical protein EP01_17820 [Bdellovibrio bacteriovorus]ASD64759.1 hypothetical protein B9G79_14900 [Bdellovibrio bacteriovorus]CAE78669.1 hypothetical protein predicted by Glimmer/Critica [Bdellovibrio bacteriovorus HD100]BEV67218.1 hypothetical protein Bb109J_c0638 [Bdellovibrio bacteriovorus]